ncbi:MAG: sigma-54-dependent Fis family transcriptional regulator [bacterium]|jgi:DNA-binding NtrC family response regulator
MHRVLVVDDDVAVTNYLMVFLAQTEEYEAAVENDSRRVLPILEREPFDAVVLDMDMPYMSGLDIMRLISERGLSVPVIILTGVGDVDLAVKAMKQGAFDYLTKPVDEETLLEVLASAVKQSGIKSSISSLPSQLKREDLSHQQEFSEFPTLDPSMIRILHEVERMALGDLPIFIQGERGTGKHLLAYSIHAISGRRGGPFIVVDAAAYDPERFSEHFFGRARDWSGRMEERAGFVEAAVGGTLFLDCVDRLTHPMQVRLNRLIKSGAFYRDGSTEIRRASVRLIAASEVDLSGEEGADFSQDLLYHLNANTVRIPPLRERPDDIPVLARHFLEEEAARLGRPFSGIQPELMEMLKGYFYPGNRSELRSIIAACAANEKGEELSTASLTPYLREILAGGHPLPPGYKPKKLRDVEREQALLAYEFYQYDPVNAAAALGITLSELEELLGTK